MSKPAPLLLDTHIWLRYLGISGKLRPASIPVLDNAAMAGILYVSVISVWEIACLVRLGRLALQPTVAGWTRAALSLPGFNLLQLTPEIAIDSVDLPDPMHKDPADRILVASARVEGLTIVTRDKSILDFAVATNLNHLQA
jgi:PIN domain nuclease of toxin-antitoxin system